MTAEEHLKRDVGALVANLLFQVAVLRAENEQLRASLASTAAPPIASANGADVESRT